MPKIILASTSPYRKQLLERLAIPFICVPPEVDEDQYKAKNLPPKELAQILAREKAQAVAKKYPDHIVIGSDQLAHLGEKILNKPKVFETALTQLQELNGKIHQLITAVCILGPNNQIFEHIDITELKMKNLSLDQLHRYIKIDNPLDCAGSYKIEEHGISLFESIISADSTAIMGLPLLAVGNILTKMNVQLLSN